jgi:hypothetical protein
MTSVDEGRLPEAAETPILRAMMAKGRASST